MLQEGSCMQNYAEETETGPGQTVVKFQPRKRRKSARLKMSQPLEDLYSFLKETSETDPDIIMNMYTDYEKGKGIRIPASQASFIYTQICRQAAAGFPARLEKDNGLADLMKHSYSSVIEGENSNEQKI